MESECIELIELFPEKEVEIMFEIEEHIDHIFERMKDNGISYDECDEPESPLLLNLIKLLEEQRAETGNVCSSEEMFFEGNWIGEIILNFCPTTAERLQIESDKCTTLIMKAARYGCFPALEEQMNKRENLYVVPRKTILLFLLDGIIAFKYREHPGRVLVENLIAGKGVRESIRDAYFPPKKPSSEFPDETPNHYQCLEYVLKNIPRDQLDINFEDKSGNTALHYAVAWKETEATRLLLQAGAYTCKANKNNMIPLQSISSWVLEQYLDSCISSNNYPPEHTDYQITFDYKIFEPPKQQIKSQKEETLRVRESEPILMLNKVSRLRKLLSHPVIMSYLYLKWRIVKKYFYYNLILYSAYWFLLNWHLYCIIPRGNITCNVTTFNNSGTILIKNFCKLVETDVWKFLIVFFCTILIFRELYQMCVRLRRYFRSPENLLELGLFASTLYLLFWVHYCPTLASAMILVSWMELVLLIGRHPRLSTYIEIFKTVALNFFKFLLLYSIMIIAFAFSFYTLFRDRDCADDKPNTFRYFISSVFKTFLMLTGEFDDSSVPLDDVIGTGHVFLILFTFLIVIVLLNLLSGLAVGDTQKIRNEAELVGIESRIELIAHIESMAVADPLQCLNFLDKLWQFFCCSCLRSRKKKQECFPMVNGKCFSILKRISSDQISSISIKTYDKRISLINTLQDSKIKIFPNRKHVMQKKLDPKIIEDANAVLKKRRCDNTYEINEVSAQILQNLRTKLNLTGDSFLTKSSRASNDNILSTNCK